MEQTYEKIRLDSKILTQLMIVFLCYIQLLLKPFLVRKKLYFAFIDLKYFDKIDRISLFQNNSSKMVKCFKGMNSTIIACVRYQSVFSLFFKSIMALNKVILVPPY